MTSAELKVKLDKAIETVEKKKKTIERHKAQAEKRLSKLTRCEWLVDKDLYKTKFDESMRFKYKTETGDDLYWDICDYEGKLRDIKDATKKLADAERIADNWQEKYNITIKREMMLATKVPEAFKKARQILVDNWVSWDISRRNIIKKRREELDYKEFRKLFTYYEEATYNKTDEQFRKIEEVKADAWLLDLCNRVKEICGDITDCSHVKWGGKCLDGVVYGTKGKAIVNTIVAGGYNIQKLHLRTLVR